ncbi:MAG TPA: alpha-ketoacid dehydrogenase subunit beta, partial [Vicinamibacteria bacterium]
MSEVTYLEAIRQTLWEEMERDSRVILLGEDVGLYGGAFKVTAGFLERFGKDRILDTPISEEGYTGVAIGAAFNGLRPVVEFQFIDFIANAFNMITNFAAKSRYRWGASVPIVMRGPAGGGVRAG